MQIAIKGSAKTGTNNAPTAANNTVTTGEDRPYTFTADDFGFADTDADDTLASVRIVTPPVTGTLALDGTAVMANGLVRKAQIDGGMLIFTPCAMRTANAYTTFTFKVNDGTANSTATYTMTIDVTDAPEPVCTPPSFGTRREIWSGTVTMERMAPFDGFDSGLSVGTLSPSQSFSIGSNSYTILRIIASFGRLDFETTAPAISTEAEKAALRLHVCDESFDFSDATVDANNFFWTAFLDWSDPVTTRMLSLSLPANHAATGEPTISGSAQVGQELTADASPIVDTDGLTDVDFTYQWLRVDADGTSNEEDISSEIAATYTLTNDDVGKKVKVKVSFTDELSGEEERTSAAYLSSGTVTVNTAPTAAYNTVTTGEDRAYTFTADDFGFADTDAGATLASVTIVTVPALGTLALDGTAVMADGVVTKAQIDGDMLTFTPARDAHGRPLCDLHLQGERRRGRQRQRLHDDHRRDGRPRPRLHGAQLRRPARDLVRHGDGGAGRESWIGLLRIQ